MVQHAASGENGAIIFAQQLEQTQLELISATERVSKLVLRHVEEVTKQLQLNESSIVKAKPQRSQESLVNRYLREAGNGPHGPEVEPASPPEDEPPRMRAAASEPWANQRSLGLGRSSNRQRTSFKIPAVPLDAWLQSSVPAYLPDALLSPQRSEDEKKSRKQRSMSSALDASVAERSTQNSIAQSIAKAREKEMALRRVAARHQLFADPETLKAQVRERMIKPQYHVADLYHTEGCAQRIARSKLFDDITLVVIVVNALWLAIDADLNPAETLLTAKPPFIIMETIFLVYFSGELAVRFCAFRHKSDAFRDRWFTFDFCLVMLMIVESVIMTAVVAITGTARQLKSKSQIIKIFRIFRMIRMARMVRLLRAAPELMTLVRGILVAGRAVLCTLALLLLIVYVFAVAFRHMASDTNIGEEYFKTVPEAMINLLLYSTVPDLSKVIENIRREEIFLAILFVIFIGLSTFTIMNMLVGVLVEVVSVVAGVERESMLMEYAKAVIADSLKTVCGLEDNNFTVSRTEFEVLLLKPECFKVIEELGVDCFALVDYCDVIFQEEQELDFEAFMEVIMQFRGTNTATVRDMVDLRKFLKQEHKAILGRISAKFGDHHVHASDRVKDDGVTSGSVLPRIVRSGTTYTTHRTSDSDQESIPPELNPKVAPTIPAIPQASPRSAEEVV
mmetsp:Transcript_34480/g.78683  ORF Transcript_34480/g.78683 Transcript_34480/m.78683 type:complete len:678 (-) Transcript_34480:105-2138(-)